MKKFLLISVCAFGLSSVALANGAAEQASAPTAGLEANSGAYVGIQGGYADTDWKSGAAGRLFLGYDINKYFGFEAGYMLIGPKDITTSAFDAVAKFKAPLFDKAGLYAKFGPGYLMTSGHNASNKVDLVSGIGAYYNFADHWTADVSYTRYDSSNTKIDHKNWQPAVDFYAVGISYKFNLPI